MLPAETCVQLILSNLFFWCWISVTMDRGMRELRLKFQARIFAGSYLLIITTAMATLVFEYLLCFWDNVWPRNPGKYPVRLSHLILTTAQVSWVQIKQSSYYPTRLFSKFWHRISVNYMLSQKLWAQLGGDLRTSKHSV